MDLYNVFLYVFGLRIFFLLIYYLSFILQLLHVGLKKVESIFYQDGMIRNMHVTF